MKISKWYFVRRAFFISCIFFFIWLFHFTIDPDFPKELKITAMFFTGALTILMTIAGALDFKEGSKYIKVVHYPIKDFLIVEHKNIIMVTFQNYGFAVPKYYKNRLNVDTIKVVYYFDKNKKSNGWNINLPHLQ